MAPAFCNVRTMRLKPEFVALLRMLDAEDGASTPVVTEAPKLLFEFNLVSRLPSGALQLTKSGSRALFQAACIEALELALTDDAARPPMDSDVERWLTSSGFLHAADRTISARGKLWLASLTPDDSVADGADAASDGAQFAARRSAA